MSIVDVHAHFLPLLPEHELLRIRIEPPADPEMLGKAVADDEAGLLHHRFGSRGAFVDLIEPQDSVVPEAVHRIAGELGPADLERLTDESALPGAEEIPDREDAGRRRARRDQRQFRRIAFPPVRRGSGSGSGSAGCVSVGAVSDRRPGDAFTNVPRGSGT
jgi:hypothetical protein